MIYQRLSYFTDYTNYFEVTMYVATVIYVSADFDLSFVTESDVLSGARYDFISLFLQQSPKLPISQLSKGLGLFDVWRDNK